MSAPTRLFESFRLGDLELKNRVVMAPMTRSRAPGNVANEMMAEYYGNRAGAGLIITEGTSPSPNGLGYPRIPGLFHAAQVPGWKLVTDRVHRNGGRIFIQLMHTGRVSHPANMPAGTRILAPSPIGLSGQMYTDARGPQPYPVPAEMTGADVETAIAEYVRSAELAVEAGFDGVELHGANGYLIDQFLNPRANQRTDEWGGSDGARMRFALETAARVAKAIGPRRVGMRVSPYGVFNDMGPFPGIDGFYAELAAKLASFGLAYIHVVDHSAMGAPPVPAEVKRAIRRAFKGTYILSGGYDRERAEADLGAGLGELVAFGRPYIPNPDLAEKLRTGAALKAPHQATFYTPGPEGYLP